MKSLPRFVACAIALGMTAGSGLAQEGGEASIETGVSYSSQRGALAFVGFKADDLLGSGVDANISYRAGEDGEGLAAGLGWGREFGTTALGQETYARLGITGRKSDWSTDAYTLETYGVDLTVGAQSAQGLRYSGRVFWQQDTLSNFDASISPLAAIPMDASELIGVSAQVGYATFDMRGALATGFSVSGNVNLATSLGDREWLSTEVAMKYSVPVTANMVLALSADAGQIAGRGGDTVSIVDRAFIGNPMPRGFAFGGIGPRDFDEGDVDTALGGNRFVTSSVELRVPTGYPSLTIGGFLDAGALWYLDEVEGGASGTIDDSYSLRTSYGLAAYWETSAGLLQINLAKPIDSLPTDREEYLSVNFGFQF